MILFLLYVILPFQGAFGDGLYLLNSNQQVTTAGYGLLMYSRGTVCDDAFDDRTADWICRMMGYESLKEWVNDLKYSWQQNYPIKLDQVQCTGSVVPQCSYATSHDCSHGEDVWLSCNIRKQRGDLNSFYLLDSSARYTQSGHGLLMYQGGTVCDDGFHDGTANWICRLIGYEAFVSWSRGRQATFQDNLPIKVDNLACSNGQYTDILPSCSSSRDTSGDSHDEDVWLWCNTPMISECPAGHKVRPKENGVCDECPSSTYSPTPNVDEMCLSCPEHSTSLAGSTHCTCVGGTYMITELDNCEKCPTGTVSREGSMASNQCAPCPGDSVPIDHGKGCSCEKGHGWFWTSDVEGTCSPCPVYFYKHKVTGICTRCPPEATSLFLSEGCICAVGLSWDSENCVDCTTENSDDGVCGCRAGTFWNAYSKMCEECPESHYSENYSESCSKCPVYTVSTPKSAECYSCLNGLSWKNFACIECPDQHIGNGAYCIKCAEGTSPSQDKTLCEKSRSTDALSVTSLVLSVLVVVLILALLISFKVVARNNTNLKLSYQPEPSTLQISERRCMCPECPCSEAILNRPALPPRGACIQDDVYANFQH